MEITELQWSDVEPPTDVLLKNVDVEGVTNNPVFQDKFLSATINRDFLRFQGIGWKQADQVVLVDVILPPITPPEEKV
jgi:hypothetical protein